MVTLDGVLRAKRALVIKRGVAIAVAERTSERKILHMLGCWPEHLGPSNKSINSHHTGKELA